MTPRRPSPGAGAWPGESGVGEEIAEMDLYDILKIHMSAIKVDYAFEYLSWMKVMGKSNVR